jgi:hypothetical protein
LIPNWNEEERLTYLVNSDSNSKTLMEVVKNIRDGLPTINLEISSNDLETSYLKLFLDDKNISYNKVTKENGVVNTSKVPINTTGRSLS